MESSLRPGTPSYIVILREHQTNARTEGHEVGEQDIGIHWLSSSEHRHCLSGRPDQGNGPSQRGLPACNSKHFSHLLSSVWQKKSAAQAAPSLALSQGGESSQK